MKVMEVTGKQLQKAVESNIAHVRNLFQPNPEKSGWIKVMRQTLGFSGAELARKMQVTRGLISNTEKAELEGRVTIKKMQEYADAMDCEFIYCMIPKDGIKNSVKEVEGSKVPVINKVNENSEPGSREHISCDLERLASEILNSKVEK